MSVAFVVARRDLWALLVTPMIYVVSSLFLLLSSYFFFMNLASFNREYVRFYESAARLDSQMPGLHNLVIEPYFLSVVFLFVFITPLIAMRLLAEERSSGTYQLLAILPISPLQIVIGKFVAGSIVVALIAALSLCYPLLLLTFAKLEVSVLLAGWVAVLLCGVAFFSISLASAAISESPFLSALIGITVLISLFFLHAATDIIKTDYLVVDKLSVYLHLEKMTQGLISLSSITFFIVLVGIGLLLTWQLLSRNR